MQLFDFFKTLKEYNSDYYKIESRTTLDLFNYEVTMKHKSKYNYIFVCSFLIRIDDINTYKIDDLRLELERAKTCLDETLKRINS